jgi:hypothetical protein
MGFLLRLLKGERVETGKFTFIIGSLQGGTTIQSRIGAAQKNYAFLHHSKKIKFIFVFLT